MTSTALVVPGETSPYALLRMDEGEVLDLIKDNLAGESLTERDLDRVRVPSGGATSWEVPTIEGEKSQKTIEGVIVNRATRRAYWQTSFEEKPGEVPDCSSDDGVHGTGEPGGACAECALNVFGSGKDDSKACKEMRQLFLLQPESLLPLVITIPPGSLANVKSYFFRLLSAQKRPYDLVTRVELEKAENKAGIKFGRVVLTAGQMLDPAAAARMKAYADILEPAFQRAARIDRADVAADAATPTD